MKKILTAALFCLIAIPLFARQDEKIETLFGEGKLTHGGYGAPEIKYADFNGNWGSLVGLKAGYIVGGAFSIGLGGYGLITDVQNDKLRISDTTSRYYLRTGYGGLILEYIWASNKMIHFTITGLVGAGGAVYTESISDLIKEENKHNTYSGSAYFVAEPGINAEINVTKFFRIGIGASYRYVSGLDPAVNIDSKDLSGASVNLALKFGKF